MAMWMTPAWAAWSYPPKKSARAHGHVTGGDGDVGVPGEIVGGVVAGREEVAGGVGGGDAGVGAGAVIDSIVVRIAEREAGHGALGVVGDVRDIGGEEGLIALVNTRCDVGPPEECLRARGAVKEAHLEFDDGAVGVQADAVHAFHAVHWFVLGAPQGDRAVRVTFDLGLHGHEGAGAVMLGPIEFDAAGNPRTGEADEGGLDHVMAVEEIVPVGFVEADMDAAADFGKDHEPEKWVFKMDGLPGVIAFFFGDAVDERKRIDFAAAALIDTVLEEHWIFVGRRGEVGGDGDGLLPDFDRAAFGRRRRREVDGGHAVVPI